MPHYSHVLGHHHAYSFTESVIPECIAKVRKKSNADEVREINATYI